MNDQHLILSIVVSSPETTDLFSNFVLTYDLLSRMIFDDAY